MRRLGREPGSHELQKIIPIHSVRSNRNVSRTDTAAAHSLTQFAPFVSSLNRINSLSQGLSAEDLARLEHQAEREGCVPQSTHLTRPGTRCAERICCQYYRYSWGSLIFLYEYVR